MTRDYHACPVCGKMHRCRGMVLVEAVGGVLAHHRHEVRCPKAVGPSEYPGGGSDTCPGDTVMIVPSA